MLLLDNDCVIVPGLGGFVGHHESARYDEDDGLFLPPIRTVGFNPKLKVNDSLLAQSYIELHDISYPEAIERIEDDVRELRERIAAEGGYTLKGIGTLSPGQNGGYEFEPSEAGILTPRLYGLYSFDIRDLSAPAEKRVKDRSTLSTCIFATAAAIAVFVIFAFYAPSINGGEGLRLTRADIQGFYSMIVNCKTAVGTSRAETEEGTAEKDEPSTTSKKELSEKTYALPADAAETKPEAEQAIATPEPAPVHYFTIVLACKIPVKNAEAYAAQLTADGYDGVSVYYNKAKQPKVVYGRFATQGEAYSVLNKMRRNKPFAEAWVFEI